MVLLKLIIATVKVNIIALLKIYIYNVGKEKPDFLSTMHSTKKVRFLLTHTVYRIDLNFFFVRFTIFKTN